MECEAANQRGRTENFPIQLNGEIMGLKQGPDLLKHLFRSPKRRVVRGAHSACGGVHPEGRSPNAHLRPRYEDPAPRARSDGGTAPIRRNGPRETGQMDTWTRTD